MKLGLYLHVPYCVRKCNYCDFKSYAGQLDSAPAYFSMLQKELLARAQEAKDYEVDSIFIGGGTPSLVDAAHIARCMEIIHTYYHVTADCEITIEANPGTLTAEKCRIYRKAGINRISLGLQSTSDGELQILGRIHTFQDYLEAVNMAVAAGFTNISTDLIFGIPGQTVESFLTTLKKVLALPVNHISAYSLIVEEGTPFYEMDEKGQLDLPEEDEERKIYWQGRELLQKHGFAQYEISNFAKEGYASRHNQKYWVGEPYLGFGVSAHSYFNGLRFWNPDSICEYNEMKAENPKAYAGKEAISFRESMQEYMMLGLRRTCGISKVAFRQKFGCDMVETYEAELAKLIGQGLVEETADAVRLTLKGMDYANLAFMEFVT